MPAAGDGVPSERLQQAGLPDAHHRHPGRPVLHHQHVQRQGAAAGPQVSHDAGCAAPGSAVPGLPLLATRVVFSVMPAAAVVGAG